MKNIPYILLLLCIMSCKNEMMKAESADIKMTSSSEETAIKPESLVSLSTQKLNEYVELINLKQQHPEFVEDINAQLLSFTTNGLSVLNYEDEFTISNIEQTGNRKVISDSVEVFTLKYTVTAGSRVFKDSILTSITSRSDYLQTVEAVSIKKVRFTKF